MRRLILSLFFLAIAILVIPTNAEAPFTAQPLYLAVYPLYTVINVVNTTYVGATSYFNNNVTHIINFVAHNSSIKIIISNSTTGAQIACLQAIIPPQIYEYVYYSPQLGSAIFLVNVSDANKFYQIPVGDLHLGILQLETANATFVNSIYVIPLGQLYTLQGGMLVYVNTTSIFQHYLNGTQTIYQDVKENLEGSYVLIFVS
jgi:hypothetical protein